MVGTESVGNSDGVLPSDRVVVPGIQNLSVAIDISRIDEVQGSVDAGERD